MNYSGDKNNYKGMYTIYKYPEHIVIQCIHCTVDTPYKNTIEQCFST